MRNFFLLTLLLLSVSHSGFSQTYLRYKWGKIDPADLKMKVYAADSGANAVILYDYDELGYNTRLTEQRYHYVRIKILKTSALDLANVTVDYVGGLNENLRDVSAQVHNLNSDGSESVQKMDSKNVFLQTLDDDRNEAKFSIPGVKVGSVIEYCYMTFNEDYSVPSFNFQADIPIREGDLYYIIPYFFKVSTIWNGDCYKNQIESSQASNPFLLGGVIQSISCEVKHIHINPTPALSDEPFSGVRDQYSCRMGFVLTDISYEGNYMYSIPNWSDENSTLLKKYFTKRQIDGSGIINQKAGQLVQNISDTMQKIKTIYSFVRDSFAWNNKYRFYSSDNLNQIFKSRSGNSADINLILILMLRNAGIRCYPVLTSTPDFGSVKTSYALPSQFNDLVCMIVKDTSKYFLDATDPENPFCFLDKTMLSRAGFVVDPVMGEMTVLSCIGKSQRITIVNAAMSDDGSIKGKAILYDQGYYGIARRKELKNFDKKKFLNAYDLNDPSTQVDSFSLVNDKNPDANLTASIGFSGDGYATEGGDKMYLKPVIFPFFRDNPFKSETRSLPVDFSFQQNYTYQVNMTIPDGYTIAESPKNEVIKLPDGSAQAKRIFVTNGNSISMLCILTMNRSFYNLSEYSMIRQFFGSYLSLGDELVVLQKKQ